MSEQETKIADAHGQYLHAVSEGERRTEATWQPCRVVITTERLGLIADEKTELALSGIRRLDDRFDDPRVTGTVSEYVVLYHGDDVVLVAGSDHEAFEMALYRAILDGERAYVKHPAVKGGVVQGVEWTPARMAVTEDALELEGEGRETVSIERADIGGLEEATRAVAGGERAVIEVEHAHDGISVETHVATGPFPAEVLCVMLGESADRNRSNLDLSSTELRVVMALHSGVSPFEIPSFVGIEVEECERIFDRLIEFDVIDVVRERTEVRLTPQGRQVAGQRGSD